MQTGESSVSPKALHAEQGSSSDGPGDDFSICTHEGTRVRMLNGLDVFNVFKVTMLVELNSTSFLFSDDGRFFVAALSSMSSGSLVIHGLLVPPRWNLISMFPRPVFEVIMEFLEWFQNWVAGFIYLALGVILPNLARCSATSVHSERTLSVANCYDLNMRFGRAYMFFSYVLWPVALLSGMVAPVLVWLPLLYGDGFARQMHIGFWTTFSVFTWSIGMLFTVPSMVEEIGIIAVRRIVDGVVKHVADMRTTPNQWQKVLDLVRATVFLVADTFDWKCLGRLIIFRVAMLFSLAIGFGFVGIAHSGEMSRTCAICFGVLAAICGCVILLRVGLIKEKCSNKRPGSKNRTAELLHVMVEQELRHDSEPTAFRQLSFYLRERTIGIELLGTRITTEFVANAALRTCFYLQPRSLSLKAYGALVPLKTSVTMI
ncbi:unnamed protein product [Prorocentrum cordatum]|uniref:Transmembrane protein n=1 Tax=Prorocentrum cordatum TaxID=2364126 RepID=A0ABN9S1C6_9DINO|nr:unnamed protein product [Polarella glacialis]